MDRTQHLDLPYLMPSQAQKHVTVNESLVALDSLVQCAVIAMGRNDPPGGTEGDRYLLGANPTGAWSGRAGQLAHWRNGGWNFAEPRPGWRTYNLADDTLYVLTSGLAWVALSGGGGGNGGTVSQVQEATRIGLGMTADAANPFAAKLNSALWTARTAAEGGTGDIFLTCNKSAEPRDAGYVFQTAFVTRAVAGLFGSNRFRIAVSPDGSAFHDALTVDDATGITDQPRLPRFKASTSYDNHVVADTWVRIGINTTELNDQGAFDSATGRFIAPVAGDYCLGGCLMFKQDASNMARMRGRLVLNGTTEILGSYGEVSGAHVSLATAMWVQTMARLAAGDAVELQGYYRGSAAFFAAGHTSFWGFKVG